MLVDTTDKTIKIKKPFFISGFLKKLTLITNFVSQSANGLNKSRILRVILNFFPQTLYIYRKGIVVYIFTGNVPDFLQQPASGQNSSLIV